MTPSRPRLAFALAALSLAACEQAATEPRPEREALYVLHSVAGATLPTAPWSGSEMRIVADSVELFVGGTGRRVLVVRDTPGAAVRREVADFEWVVQSDTLAVSFACPNDALVSCIAPPHLKGAVDDAEWRADAALPYQGTARYFSILLL